MELNNWTTSNSIEDIINKITAETTLFFDMDGTLINTNYSNFLSYKSAIQSVTKTEYDLTYNSDKRFNRSALEHMVCNLNAGDYYRIINEKEECYKNFLHETTINQEIVDILFKYMKTNKTVLVTNCREERAIMTLNYHGLHDKFSNLFFRQLDNNKKINKYKHAIQILDISPNSVLIFEDEINEIKDAIQAGINPYNVIKL